MSDESIAPKDGKSCSNRVIAGFAVDHCGIWIVDIAPECQLIRNATIAAQSAFAAKGENVVLYCDIASG